jgi:hypothetical protein
MVTILFSYNKKVEKYLWKMSQNAMNISPTIQKEIFNIFLGRYKIKLEKTSTMKSFDYLLTKFVRIYKRTNHSNC